MYNCLPFFPPKLLYCHTTIFQTYTQKIDFGSSIKNMATMIAWWCRWLYFKSWFCLSVPPAGIPRTPHPSELSPYYPLSPGAVGSIAHPLGWLMPQWVTVIFSCPHSQKCLVLNSYKKKKAASLAVFGFGWLCWLANVNLTACGELRFRKAKHFFDKVQVKKQEEKCCNWNFTLKQCLIVMLFITVCPSKILVHHTRTTINGNIWVHQKEFMNIYRFCYGSLNQLQRLCSTSRGFELMSRGLVLVG